MAAMTFSNTPDANPIARVAALHGEAFAKGKDGSLRPLHLGDPIFASDVLVTADGARLEITSIDDHSLVIGGNETVTVDAEVMAAAPPDAADAAVQVDNTDVSRVIQAINEGGNLDQLLEETAAGNAVAGTDGGPSFVRLLRIAESVDPLSFEYDTARQAVVDDPISGGLASDGISTALTPNTIADAATPRIGTVGSPSVNEGGNLDFAVTLTLPSATPTTVTLTPASGTATLGTDTGALQVSFDGGLTFSPITGNSVDVPAGSTAFIVRMPTINDGVSEPTESVTLGAATPNDASPVLGTGTILDPSVPVLSIAGPVDVNEAAGTLTYTISLSNPSTSAISVDVATANGSATAGSDYAALTQTVSFAAGETSKTVTVAITDDATYEGPENFTLGLSGATGGAAIGSATVTTTIHDDGTGLIPPGNPNVPTDDTPRVTSVVGDSIVEGGYNSFTVNLSNASTTPTTTTLALASGSATIGTDTGAVQYSTDSGSTWNTYSTGVAVPAGVTSFQVRVATIDDTVFEGNESYTLTATANGGAALGTGSIVDNDAAPRITGISVQHATEGADLVCTVTLDQVPGTPFTLPHRIGGGSASLADYGTPIYSNGVTVVGADLLIPAGVSSFSITLPTVDDSLSEPTEKVPFTFGALTIDGNIYDNDAAPSLSIDNVSVNEAAGTATFTVSLSAASGQAISVNYASSNGTATAVSDFAAVTGTLNFAAGDLSKTITVPITDDTIFEGSENFTITLSGPTNASIGTPSGTGTIVDNDSAPVVSSISSPTVAEGADLVYDIALSNASTTSTTLAYSLGGGSASAADYGTPSFNNGVTLVGGNLLIPAGVTSFSVTVPTLDDVINEPTETLPLIIGGVTGTGSITDDGAPLAVNDHISTNEDTPVTIVVRNNDSDPEGDSLTVSAVTQGAHGTVIIDPVTGNPIYTPHANYSGADSFTYTINDGHGGTSTATVNLDVASVPDLTAANDAGSGPRNTLIEGSVASNDATTSGGSLVFAKATDPAHGSVVVDGDGQYHYTPNADFFGGDSFTYTVTDAASGEALTRTVNLTVTDADARISVSSIAGDDVLSGSETTGTVSIIGTVGGDAVAGDIVSTTINGQTYSGTVAADGVSYSITGVAGTDLMAAAGNPVSVSLIAHDELGNPFTVYAERDYSTAATLSATTVAVDPAAAGLRSEYYGYNDGTNASYRVHADDNALGNLDSISDMQTIINGRNGGSAVVGTITAAADAVPDAVFQATRINYGHISGSLGTNTGSTQKLNDFLKATDAATVVGTPGQTTDAGIRFIGYLDSPAGSYDIRIHSDDGFRLMIDGTSVADFNGIRSPGNSFVTNVTLTGGLVPIEILYWDQAGEAVLHVEFKPAGAPDSAYVDLGTGDLALVSPDFAPILTPLQDIIADPAHAGQYLIRSGQEYTGTNGVDQIAGGDGRDAIYGGAGDDVINGGANDDQIHGGAGNDQLTGGLGSDVFAWHLGDQGTQGAPAIDTIIDFSASTASGSKDILDLRDLLQGENQSSGTGNLANYLHFEKSGANTIVHISSDGGFGGDAHTVGAIYTSGHEDQVIVLQGVDLAGSMMSDQQIIDDLLTKGKLLTD